MKRGSTDRETCDLNGWEIGDVLVGSPIFDRQGRKVEPGVQIVLTHFTVQGGVMAIREYDTRPVEHSWSLDSREWRKQDSGTFSK